MGSDGAKSGLSGGRGKVGGISKKAIAERRQFLEQTLSKGEASLKKSGGVISDADAIDILKQEYLQEKFLGSIKKGNKLEGLGESDRKTILASESLMPRYMNLLSGISNSKITRLRKEAREDVDKRLK